jgi:hypothetical protein
VVGRRVQPGAEAQSATDDDDDGLQLAADHRTGTATYNHNDGLQLAADDDRTGTGTGTAAGTAAARAGRLDLRVREQHAARHGNVAAQDDDAASGYACGAG